MQDNHFWEMIIWTSWSSLASVEKCRSGRNLLFALITASSWSLPVTCFFKVLNVDLMHLRNTAWEGFMLFALITASSRSLRLPDTCFDSQWWAFLSLRNTLTQSRQIRVTNSKKYCMRRICVFCFYHGTDTCFNSQCWANASLGDAWYSEGEKCTQSVLTNMGD